MKKISLLFLLIALLSGCNRTDNKTAILLTNIPDIAAYVELFNASHSTYRIELVYADNPANLHKIKSDKAPDIVISKNLNSKKIISSFASLKNLSGKNKLNSSYFYQPLYKLCFYKGEQRLLPVSFNVPAVVYRSDTILEDGSSLTFTPEMLEKEGQLYNSKIDNKNVMGFSAIWEPDFLIDLNHLYNSDFSESSNGDITWNEEALKKSISFCKEISKGNSGYEKERDFLLTYCYDPDYKLLNSGRIGFYFSSLKDFYEMPSSERSTLGIKWFGSSSSIPVKEDIVYAGIPEKSKKQAAAKQFLLWFFNADNQKAIIESTKFKRLQGFGICNGFSSLIAVNENIIPNFYRDLIGNIPPQSFFSFPARLPQNWNTMKDEVIIPWMNNQLAGNANDQKLSTALKTWTLQQEKE